MDVAYPYLAVDARYEHVRQGGQVVSQGVLIVMDVREDGLRELLAVAVADTESEATYDELVRRSPSWPHNPNPKDFKEEERKSIDSGA